MQFHRLIWTVSKQARSSSSPNLDQFIALLRTGLEGTSTAAPSASEFNPQRVCLQGAAEDLHVRLQFNNAKIFEGLRDEEGLRQAVSLSVSLNHRGSLLPVGSMPCLQAPSPVAAFSSAAWETRVASFVGPTQPVQSKALVQHHVSQANLLSTRTIAQRSPYLTCHLSPRLSPQLRCDYTQTALISGQPKVTSYRSFSTLSAHAINKHAPLMSPLVSASSANHYTTSELPSASVSVRTAHGAGTEGLQGLAPEGLRRVDTDQATESSSNDTSAVKDVLGGSEKQAFTPVAPPPTDSQIESLHDFIVDSEKLVIITGAGVSTESGIPDYRSPTGAYSTGFKPMTHQEFVRSAASRQRYWARSYFGWRRFSGTQPNDTHRAIATLEQRGRVRGGMITQNVDRLHHACGSDPLELHGTTHHVVCMSCNDLSGRQDFQEKLAAMNPQWIDSIEAAERGEDVLAGTPGLQRPDGDVEIGEEFLRKGLFQVPKCEKCGADALKPDVVFFGDNVPKWRVDRAAAMVRDSDAMLVVGSSLMVLSAFRLARAAADDHIPIAILNVGPTRADDLATLRVGARSGEVFARLLNTGSLALPL